jgi:peptidoglycan hydrolase CwlO-like protein
VAAGIAAAAEGLVIYHQWPSPPLKICASVEFGELLAAAAKGDADLREVRTQLRKAPDDAVAKEVMRLEAVSAAAANAVAIYKQRAQERQKASGSAAREGTCN